MITYQNEFARIKTLLNFKLQDKIITKYYKKGNVKNYYLRYKSTKSTKCLSFLSKYGYERISNYIFNKTDFKNNDTKIFYNDLKYFIDKFGEKRLLNLTISKRNRIINSINVHNFKSLSFKSQTRINKNIFKNNKNKKSIIDGFITIGGYNNYKKGLNIPIKLSNKYHRHKSKEYSKTYTVQFNNEKINRIIIPKQEKITIPENNNLFVGVDLNIKNNLFTTSDNDSIDYDRNLMDRYIKFLKKIDNRKSKKLSIKRKMKYNHWQLKIHNYILEKAVELIKIVKQKGNNHIVLEDLDLMSSLKSMNIEFDINNGRLLKLLNLSSIKHKIRKLGYKYNVNVSFVNSEYTSITCSECGNININNRKHQEKFACTKCNNKLNADYNASINIKNRVLLDVLKDKLLIYNGYEYNCKKNINHKIIKNIIYDYYSSCGL